MIMATLSPFTYLASCLAGTTAHCQPAGRLTSQQATVISQQKMAGKGAIEWFGCGVDRLEKFKVRFDPLS